MWQEVKKRNQLWDEKRKGREETRGEEIRKKVYEKDTPNKMRQVEKRDKMRHKERKNDKMRQELKKREDMRHKNKTVNIIQEDEIRKRKERGNMRKIRQENWRWEGNARLHETNMRDKNGRKGEARWETTYYTKKKRRKIKEWWDKVRKDKVTLTKIETGWRSTDRNRTNKMRKTHFMR